MQTRITAVEASRIEYDGARKDLAVAREAQLKHARKTDGQVDGSLQSHDTRAESVLTGAHHMPPALTRICLTIVIRLNSCSACTAACWAALKSPGYVVKSRTRCCGSH